VNLKKAKYDLHISLMTTLSGGRCWGIKASPENFMHEVGDTLVVRSLFP